MATIVTKNNSVAGTAPTAGDLVEGELAVNTEDGRLFTLQNGGAVKQVAPSTVGVKEVQKVSALPGTPDADTVYFVVP